jgi:hypothetical protein
LRHVPRTGDVDSSPLTTPSADDKAAFDETRPLLDSALAALRADGRAAEVRASFGTVFLPDEAEEAMDALMIADRAIGVVRRARERRASPRSITPFG